MCIEFVYINNSPPTDGFRLIVTNNRDEYFSRPAKPADFWEDNPDCISGLDQFPGRENGTWFAASKFGKIGSLLNILTPEGPLPHKEGRGRLAVDYVSQTVPAAEYLESLSEKSSRFNLYQLILLEKSENARWSLYYYTNSSDSEAGIVELEDGIHGFSNSVLEKPFQKVLRGKERFATIIENFGRKDTLGELQEAILNLMWDRSCSLPDSQLAKQGGKALDDLLLKQKSGICVYAPQADYGTRTTTVLTVSADNCCTYTETTMKEPIDGQKPEWQTATYTFTIQS